MKVAFVFMNQSPIVARGAGYVASAIREAGHDLAFFDTAFTSISDIADSVRREQSDVLMISTVALLFNMALDLVREVKSLRQIPVIVGGSHPTTAGPSELKDHPEIDYLCIGEGESMVVEFLAALEDGNVESLRNLAYRQGDSIGFNPARPPEDLAALPPFPWDLFPVESIVQTEIPGVRHIYVMASRGCPFDCSYCANGAYLDLYGRKYLRFRPIPEVVDELRHLKETYQPNAFFFGDEMMLGDKKYAAELFSAVHRHIGLPYGFLARPETVNDDIVRHMAATGCRYIGMGLECGDAEFRRTHLNRRMTDNQIRRAFTIAKRHGLFTLSFNMIGYPFPFDDRLTESTVRLNQEIEPDYATFSIFYPIPGTRLHRHCVDNDLIDPDKARNISDYFVESVLRGVEIADRKNEIEATLNPEGFKISLEAPPKPGLLKRLKRWTQ